MPFYFGDYGLVNVRTDSVGVHQLPNNWALVSGVTPPAAVGGTKNLAAKPRGKISVHCFLGFVKDLSASRGVKVTASVTLHTSPVYLDASVGMKISPVRLILEVNASAPTVHLDGSLFNKLTPAFDLAVLAAVTLDGTLLNKVTLTGDLYRLDGKLLDATLLNRFSVGGAIKATGIGHGGLAQMRPVGNLAVLHIGTIHYPVGLLRSKWTATAQLTINYMRALLRVRWQTTNNLYVKRYLIGASALAQTSSGDLTVLRAFASSVGLKQTATARLFTPLRATVGVRVRATAVPLVVRQFTGLSQPHITALLGLRVVRTYQASVGARQTVTGTLTAARRLQASLRVRSVAGVTLEARRWLAVAASMRWTGRLVLDDIRQVIPPVGADITVMPDLAVEIFSLPVQVESPDTTVYVED